MQPPNRPVVRPTAPKGARSWVLLVLDSLRYDAVLEARPPNLLALGPLERRWSYATWTAPSHYNLLMGLLPHPAPRETWSAQVYREGLARLQERLGVTLDPASLAPSLWLPSWLQAHGWHTGAWVSLPVLHPSTPLSRGFDHYALREEHADLAGIIDALRFYREAPSFWLINAGETHYPYTWPGGPPPTQLPRLSGFHGAVRRTSDAPGDRPSFFSASELEGLRQRQVEALRYVDGLIPRLRALCPPGTWLTVTSDHGECFGEDGFFGHGPVNHPKVLEVPLVEGPLC